MLARESKERFGDGRDGCSWLVHGDGATRWRGCELSLSCDTPLANTRVAGRWRDSVQLSKTNSSVLPVGLSRLLRSIRRSSSRQNKGRSALQPGRKRSASHAWRNSFLSGSWLDSYKFRLAGPQGKYVGWAIACNFGGILSNFHRKITHFIYGDRALGGGRTNPEIPDCIRNDGRIVCGLPRVPRRAAADRRRGCSRRRRLTCLWVWIAEAAA